MTTHQKIQLNWIYLSIFLLIPLGLFSKRYQGIGADWVRSYAGDILIEVFLCCVFYLMVYTSSKITINFIAIWVFIISCIIEFSQLIQTSFFNEMRASFLGRVILGTTFSPDDFLYYAIGSCLGWLWLKYLSLLPKNS